ncbi:4-hydroxybenzoate octaprenyltransferase [Actinoplanes couchii]|uniref:4-hydroxybenzoate octaprenyltransferase n=1 Tax=Actinoplanes couchii TaxID=403638 RepID=A0ABQ3XU74_9ACTN|nr:4-hydroxybenzoate octaprenyltransferase [Actinoplanes couchii]MDR6319978.1 4-hydroxybenzoate polyprenyltransferase [Actinoplanes couchii]GID62068.1 4-hydroxybenzoate octaprenyltransferase [Actinoplanes couchii]
MTNRAVERLGAYGRLLRLHRPVGIWLLMWPTLWALWTSSGGRPDGHVFAVFMAGTVLTRSAGCAINDLADRRYDGRVRRTRDRPLVTGEVSPVEAVVLCAVLGVVALAAVSTLNTRTRWLAVAAVALMVAYPLAKRFFPAPQLLLGVAFTWSVPMAYAAHGQPMPRPAWLLFTAGLLWTVAYDTMYAMADRADDRAIGIRSTAILLGSFDRPAIAVLQAAALVTLALVGRDLNYGLWFTGGLVVAAVLAARQQHLIRTRDPEACLRAFTSNNFVGMAVFAGIALEHLVPW